MQRVDPIVQHIISHAAWRYVKAVCHWNTTSINSFSVSALFIRTWHVWKEQRESQTHQADIQIANHPVFPGEAEIKRETWWYFILRETSWHNGLFMFKCNTIFIIVLILFSSWFIVSMWVCLYVCMCVSFAVRVGMMSKVTFLAIFEKVFVDVETSILLTCCPRAGFVQHIYPEEQIIQRFLLSLLMQHCTRQRRCLYKLQNMTSEGLFKPAWIYVIDNNTE